MATIRKNRSKRTRGQVAWDAAKNRCYFKSGYKYSRYGGRGIVMCDEWKNSSAKFLEDMGEPGPGMTLERIDNDGPYCKENCRWATKSDQARNRSSNLIIEAFGVSRTAIEWAELNGINRTTISLRLQKKWSPEDAVSLPAYSLYRKSITA